MTGIKAADEHRDVDQAGAHQRACVVGISEVAQDVKQFELRGIAGGPLSPFSAGAHVVMTLRDQDRVWRNPYSIMGATADGDGYVISVRNSPDSQGGSRFLHTRVCVGFELEISQPINNFAVANTARKHVLIAGGMGITPMLAMLDELQRDKANAELHYAVRSEMECGHVSRLPSDVLDVVRLYISDRGERIPLESVLSERSAGSHVYVCGPQRLIDAVLDVARRSGWPKEAVHCENLTSHSVGPAHGGERAREHSDMLESYLMTMREFTEPVRKHMARRVPNSPLRKSAKAIPVGYFIK